VTVVGRDRKWQLHGELALEVHVGRRQEPVEVSRGGDVGLGTGRLLETLAF